MNVVHPKRIQQKNDCAYNEGPILYWMNSEQRTYDNCSLLFAQALSQQHHAPLAVVFNLELGFLGGGYRHHAFKVKGLQDVESALKKKNIPFYVITKVGSHTQLLAFIKKYKFGAVVTDLSPLRKPQSWIRYIVKHIDIPLYEVDARNVVPLWVTSHKQEYAARTIRPKIHKHVAKFLTNIPAIKKQTISWKRAVPHIPWQKILRHPTIDQDVPEATWIVPGQTAAKKALTHFLKKGLVGYDEKRNNPTLPNQSNLSPYIHHGHLSPIRIALSVKKAKGVPLKDRKTFLEELIVRRELAANFCYYNHGYDSVDGFPDWAKISLKKHLRDTRDYVYTKKQFEEAKTHDPLWNAAQMQMVRTGKMHGYMRMYWAKKILEWTKKPSQALKIAIYLNDKYELDGRDPNGYAGIAWSMGGVHDRPWFERPVFGKIRYMNANGCKRKFDVQQYIDTHLDAVK